MNDIDLEFHEVDSKLILKDVLPLPLTRAFNNELKHHTNTNTIHTVNKNSSAPSPSSYFPPNYTPLNTLIQPPKSTLVENNKDEPDNSKFEKKMNQERIKFQSDTTTDSVNEPVQTEDKSNKINSPKMSPAFVGELTPAQNNVMVHAGINEDDTPIEKCKNWEDLSWS